MTSSTTEFETWLEGAVTRGAAFLDEKAPGWFHRLDRNALEMNDCSRCVLGQLFGNYYAALEARQYSTDEAAGMGFSVARPFSGVYENWVRLRARWLQEIDGRRAPA